MFGTLQPMPPLLKSQFDGEELSVANIIIIFRRAEFVGEEGTWMESGWSPLLLR